MFSYCGAQSLYAVGDKAVGYGQGSKAYFWITEQDRPPSQVHVEFKANQSPDVEAFFTAAIAHIDRDNRPTEPTPKYHDRYFAAFVLDPDGKNTEAVISTTMRL